MAFSPDSKLLATGGGDSDIRLWDVAKRQQRGVLRGHTGPVLSVTFSPDGKSLATASGWGEDGGVVRLWDLTTEPAHSRLQLSGAYSVAFSLDGKRLAAGESGGALKLYDAATGEQRAQLRGHLGAIHALAFSPDGKTLASASFDRVVRLWDVATQQELSCLAHSEPVYSVAFSSDGRTLASGAEGGVARLWDLETHPDPTTLQQRGAGKFVAFSLDSKTLISGGQQIRRWDVGTGEARGAIALQGRGWSISPNTKVLASWDTAGVRVWDLATRQV